MKTQTIGDSAEIVLSVPSKEAEKVIETIQAVLALAGHKVLRVNAEGEELVSAKEVFPESSPGNRLRGLRGKEDLTQVELAQRLGISQNRVSDMESGKRAISAAMARKIGAAFGIDHRVFL